MAEKQDTPSKATAIPLQLLKTGELDVKLYCIKSTVLSQLQQKKKKESKRICTR